MMREIGIPKSAPKAVKQKDEKMDKAKGLREGSPQDLKADRMILFLMTKKKKKK